MKTVLIQAKHAKKIFAQNTGDTTTVLDDINVALYEGDFTVIMGASGAGKSTLLYAFSGMDTLTSGEILYQGKNIQAFSPKQMAGLRAKEFGFVFQQAHLVSNLTLFENVAVAGYVGGKQTPQAVRENALALLTQMQVAQAAHRLPSQVSGGEAQRAALARAVIGNPTLLFADEPTGALNKKNSEEVLDRLTTLNEAGQSILMVTHALRAASRGNRILYMEDGNLLAELALPVYAPQNAREREAKITQWLATLQW